LGEKIVLQMALVIPLWNIRQRIVFSMVLLREALLSPLNDRQVFGKQLTPGSIYLKFRTLQSLQSDGSGG